MRRSRHMSAITRMACSTHGSLALLQQSTPICHPLTTEGSRRLLHSNPDSARLPKHTTTGQYTYLFSSPANALTPHRARPRRCAASTAAPGPSSAAPPRCLQDPAHTLTRPLTGWRPPVPPPPRRRPQSPSAKNLILRQACWAPLLPPLFLPHLMQTPDLPLPVARWRLQDPCPAPQAPSLPLPVSCWRPPDPRPLFPQQPQAPDLPLPVGCWRPPDFRPPFQQTPQPLAVPWSLRGTRCMRPLPHRLPGPQALHLKVKHLPADVCRWVPQRAQPQLWQLHQARQHTLQGCGSQTRMWLSHSRHSLHSCSARHSHGSHHC